MLAMLFLYLGNLRNGREPRLELLGAAYFCSNKSSLMERENHFLRYLHIIKKCNTAKIYLSLKRPNRRLSR